MAKEIKKALGILGEVQEHYQYWTEDNDTRRTRKNGWDDVTDAYWGKLPKNFPYNSQIVDPRIRTSLIEKNARLINNKLRGRLVPRESGDVIKARLNNAILDFQWDNASEGGSMLQKVAMSDIDARLYASKFALVTWRYECKKGKDGKEKTIFNGNEMRPLDIRDCGIDPSADNIKNAKWFQYREWKHLDEIDSINDASPTKEQDAIKIAKLKTMVMDSKQSRRDNAYTNRVLSNKGLTDRVGTDSAFPVVELVTEYRRDKWITFSPDYNIIIREIDNPYAHGKIPVAQLCYYPIAGDPLGESEVEPVLPLWKGIQAVLCGFLDNYATHVQPPLKIRESATKIETIIFGPAAQWLMNDPSSDVMEFTGSQHPLNYFQTTYLSLVSAYNTAMGDASAGVSNIDPTSNKRTATEIRNSTSQQNHRDQRNQAVLSEFLSDIMMMWLSNNRQFLLLDNKQEPYLLKIVGSDNFNYFKRAGLDEMTASTEAVNHISQIIEEQGGNVGDADINEMLQAGEMPRYPVVSKGKQILPKMEMNEMNDEAVVRVTPEDMDGDYDYIADVRSMASGAIQEQMDGRGKIMEMMQNPQILQMLQAEGIKLNTKELLTSVFEDFGLKDADRYFTKMEQSEMTGANGQPQTAGQDAQPNPMEIAQQTQGLVGDMKNEQEMMDQAESML